MTTSQELFLEDFLAHYGTAGMKWGVRNKRPTILTSNKTDHVITKKAKDDYNKLSDKQFFMKYASRKSTYAKRVEKHGDPYLARVAKLNKGKVGELSPANKALIIYGGAIATLVLASKGMMRADSGRKDARKTGDKPFKENSSLKGKMSVAQLNNKVVKPINPGYGEKGTKMNCRRATMAYEMRRRGYDVKATKSKYASGQTEKGLKTANTIGKDEKWQSVWGQKEVSDVVSYSRMSPQQKADAVFSSLSASHPNGARGEIGSGWIMGGGHSQAFEIVNRKPVIFDTQNGKVYDSPAAYSAFTGTTSTIAHTRLDNRAIDNDFIKRWVTDV